MQADVHELGGDIFIFRPLARRIRDDESDPMLAQQGDERRIDEAFVPHFERVTKGTARTEAEPGTALHFVVVAARDRGGGVGIVRQQR